MKKVFENILKIILFIFLFYFDVIIAFCLFQAYRCIDYGNDRFSQNQYIETADGEKFFYYKTESESKETVRFNTYKKVIIFTNVSLYRNYRDFRKNRNPVKCSFAKTEFLPDYIPVPKDHYLYKKLDYRYHKIYEFNDKYYLVKHDGSYGLCDRQGKFVIEPNCQGIYLFHNSVITGQKWLDLDLKDRKIAEGLLAVTIADDDLLEISKLHNKRIYADPSGRVLWESSKVKAHTYYNGLAKGSELINPKDDFHSENCLPAVLDRKGSIIYKGENSYEGIILLKDGDYLMIKEGWFSLVKFFDYIFMRF